MHTIVHLSDLHMDLTLSQGPIFEALVEVLSSNFAHVGRRADLLVITGDVFDSAHLPIRAATHAFAELQARLLTALGGATPTVIIPGNHDRRRRGFVGPHDTRLFRALREAVGSSALVHGSDHPFLGAVVPRHYHRLPLSLIAYDSTYLPRGLLSAGGVIRQEDVLAAAAQLKNERSDEPVLFLLHHHLVPTPLTDVGSISLGSASGLLRWSVRKLLPALIANADKEELTMTALGSGTALSTLHELGRAVLVLHGHKHYATARMLRGMIATQGDVLIASAGSCGLAEAWSPNANRDAARLWPSFNLVELDGNALRVETIAFGYKGRSVGRFTRRPLAQARRQGAAWDVTQVALEPSETVGPALTRNHRVCRIAPSSVADGRLDYECRRIIDGNGLAPRRYVEVVGAIAGTRVLVDTDEHIAPALLELPLGREIRYRVEAGLCRTVAASDLVRGRGAPPFEWLGLVNRYACDDVRLRVEGPRAMAVKAFGSTTDLGTGIEQPLELAHPEPGTVEACVAACPPRTLLRIYFPLETRS